MKSKIVYLGISVSLATLATLAGAGAGLSAQDGDAPARPVHRADGTVEVPAFALPPSAFMSEEGRAILEMRGQRPEAMPTEQEPDIAKNRAWVDKLLSGQVSAMEAAYPVAMEETEVAGVPVRIFTPADGVYDKERVLINVHGGGFTVCWDSCSKLESIPIASVGDYKVVSVDYRMAPEAKHPAGIEDTVAVYRELLKTYEPDEIGLYGCSAGGSLTAQTTAWLAQNAMPVPGAVGIFGAGAVRLNQGDSAYVAAYIDGSFPPPSKDGAMDITRGYFDGADMDGPVLGAAQHPEVMAKFPPTMLITGTRAMDMSPAIYTNSMLLKAGVDSTLIVGEGMGHCYIYMAQLPEAQDAYAATVAFFRDNLD